jgi:hypothetical protein
MDGWTERRRRENGHEGGRREGRKGNMEPTQRRRTDEYGKERERERSAAVGRERKASRKKMDVSMK